MFNLFLCRSLKPHFYLKWAGYSPKYSIWNINSLALFKARLKTHLFQVVHAVFDFPAFLVLHLIQCVCWLHIYFNIQLISNVYCSYNSGNNVNHILIETLFWVMIDHCWQTNSMRSQTTCCCCCCCADCLVILCGPRTRMILTLL